jgi:hypothetical protein
MRVCAPELKGQASFKPRPAAALGQSLDRGAQIHRHACAKRYRIAGLPAVAHQVQARAADLGNGERSGKSSAYLRWMTR